MSYPDAQTLNQAYSSTQWLIKKHAGGLSHADSVVQPLFKANCFNWVLGHIISGRNEALTYLGGPPLWAEEELALYKTGSQPITNSEQALPLERLLADLDKSLPGIRFGERPVGQHIDGLQWHETYHTGQLEILRELALSS